MATKLVPPQLGPLDEANPEPLAVPAKPNLRSTVRRTEPQLGAMLRPGFVGEATVSPAADPDDEAEGLTIEVPRRVKRALLAEVAARRNDPDRRAVASMKSVILEALAAKGFAEFIRESDIEVQAGIFMKRQSAQLKRR